MSPDPKIERYLGDVRAQLGSSNASEEEQVVRLIAERIEALSAAPGSAVDSAIEQLGPAKKVARAYRDANLISRAASSNSPLLLLHASLRNGLGGLLAFLLGLAGYWLGGCVAVFGTLALIWSAVHYKPNANAAIGSSMFDDAATAVVGLVLIVLTTVMLRMLLGRVRDKGTK